MFSYNNGKVSPTICSVLKDSVASMNLKRAILSALQVSSVQEDQHDFFEVFFYNVIKYSINFRYFYYIKLFVYKYTT